MIATGYAYSTETRRVLAVIRGTDNAAVERAYAARYGDSDSYGLTYSPAFGAVDGLIDSADAAQVDADAPAEPPRKQRTITLTDRAPVKIYEDEWPVIACATGDSCEISDYARRQQALARGECDTYSLRVRRHADGRCLVYSVLDAAIAAWHAPAGGESWRGGELLDAGENLAEAIRRVGTDGGLPDSLIRDCLADLPAEEL